MQETEKDMRKSMPQKYLQSIVIEVKVPFSAYGVGWLVEVGPASLLAGLSSRSAVALLGKMRTTLWL